MDHLPHNSEKIFDNSSNKKDFFSEISSAKNNNEDQLTNVMKEKIKKLSDLKGTCKTIEVDFKFNIVFHHKFQPLMKEVNEYKTICENNPTRNNLALLKRAIDLSDHIMDTKASLVDKVGYFVCKWLGLSEISEAENLFNSEYSKLTNKVDQKERMQVDGLVLVYKRFHNTEEINENNLVNLINSCEGKVCAVENLIFVEKGKGAYTGTILYGVPEGEGTIVLPTGSIYTGNWANSRTSGKGKWFFPATKDEGAYSRKVNYKDGKFEKGSKTPLTINKFKEEIDRLNLAQNLENSYVFSQNIVEDSENEVNSNLNTKDVVKSENEIQEDLKSISEINKNNIKSENKWDADGNDVILLDGNSEWPAGELGKDKKLYGYAIKKYKNGDEAIGLFNQGMLVDGTLTLKDGTKGLIVKEAGPIDKILEANKKFIDKILDPTKKFKEFKKGTLNHFGELVGQWEIHNTNGTKKRGTFYQGKLDGYGEKIDPHGNVTEQGLYANGELVQSLKFVENKLYIGMFDQHGRLEGKGILIENGVIFEGSFASGRQQGMFIKTANRKKKEVFFK